MILQEIIHYLQQVAPLRFQESYDNAGLLVGHPSMPVNGIMVSLDATPAVVDDAISQGCNLIVSHHPIIFKGIKQFQSDYYVHETVIKAIKHDIALYAIHTNLDNVLQDGVNQKIAQKIGLTDIDILKPHKNDPLENTYRVGAGALGTHAEGLNGSDFIRHVKDAMSLKVVKHTAILDSPIKRVAVCGGSGSFLLPDAIAAGADAYISADFKYHEYFDANDQILILDIGHYESEYYTIELLSELISKKFPTFAPRYTDVVTNPIFYS